MYESNELFRKNTSFYPELENQYKRGGVFKSNSQYDGVRVEGIKKA